MHTILFYVNDGVLYYVDGQNGSLDSTKIICPDIISINLQTIKCIGNGIFLNKSHILK